MDKHDTRAQAADAEGRATGQVRVWDPLVRIGHWLLVAAFFTAYIAGDDAQTVHVWAGYTVAAIIAWRIVWGVVGSRHARFTDFVRGPGAAFAYLRGMASGKARRHLTSSKSHQARCPLGSTRPVARRIEGTARRLRDTAEGTARPCAASPPAAGQRSPG